MQTTKLYVQLYENNIETGLEEKKNSLSQPPPFPKIPRPLITHPSGISNPFRGVGMDIFWNYTIPTIMVQINDNLMVKTNVN